MFSLFDFCVLHLSASDAAGPEILAVGYAGQQQLVPMQLAAL